MAEVKTPARTFLVTYTCDYCGVGEMAPTGRAYPTSPMQYQHQCTNERCGKTDNFRCAYPKTVVESIEEEPTDGVDTYPYLNS